MMDTEQRKKAMDQEFEMRPALTQDDVRCNTFNHVHRIERWSIIKKQRKYLRAYGKITFENEEECLIQRFVKKDLILSSFSTPLV